MEQFQNKTDHTDGTVPKFNRQIVERGKIDTINTQKELSDVKAF
jgi:hypothetical protein